MGTADGTGKNKIVAGVLGILLGVFGVHHFYLGSNMTGVILLLVTIVIGGATCGVGIAVTQILGLVEGILLLVMSDEEFDAKYNDRTPNSVEFVFQNPHKNG